MLAELEGCTPQALCRVARVCRAWRAAVDASPELWRATDVRGRWPAGADGWVKRQAAAGRFREVRAGHARACGVLRGPGGRRPSPRSRGPALRLGAFPPPPSSPGLGAPTLVLGSPTPSPLPLLRPPPGPRRRRLRLLLSWRS
jgi:hypothetical protein